MNVTVINEIDRCVDGWYARQDFIDARDREVEWLNRCEDKHLIALLNVTKQEGEPSCLR